GEIYKAFFQNKEDILALMVSDKADNDSMFTYAIKAKLLVTFFEQHEHNNRLPDEEFGSSDCICFTEASPYNYEYIDNRATCMAQKHFGELFITRLRDNVELLRSKEPIAIKPSSEHDRIAHLIEAVLNSSNDDFAGSVPFDVLYIFGEILPT